MKCIFFRSLSLLEQDLVQTDTTNISTINGKSQVRRTCSHLNIAHITEEVERLGERQVEAKSLSTS